MNSVEVEAQASCHILPKEETIMRVSERMKKVLSIALTLCMVLSCIPTQAYAVGTDCTHHTQHTDDCGYVEAVEGSKCTFVCEECKAEEKTCTCGAAEEGEDEHAPFCDLYERTYEECKCVLDCAVEGLNDYCETCYFEGVEACAASGEEEDALFTVTEGDCGTGVRYAFDNVTGVLTISGSGAIAKKTNATQYPWNSKKTSITKIVIESGVTNIPQYAFNTSSANSVIIPDTVTEIGKSAFYGNANLTSISIPSSVTTIGETAFKNCSNLETVYTNCDETEWNTKLDKNAFQGTLAADEGFIYSSPPATTNYTVTVNVSGNGTVSGDGTYPKGDEVTVIATPDTNYKFVHWTENGTSVSTTKIYQFTLTGDRSLTAVFEEFTPNSGACGMDVYYTFDEATGVLTISGTGAMKDYLQGEAPWYDLRAQIKSVVIENGITIVSQFGFYECDQLTGVTIPDSVTSFGTGAFSGCDALTSFTIPPQVKSMGQGVFTGCSNLTNVTISEGVGILPANTFASTPLTSITIPASVKSIQLYAFYDCEQLTTVNYLGLEDPVSINEPYNVEEAQQVFRGCNISGITVNVPAGYQSEYFCGLPVKLAHEHQWEYTANGTTITAACTAENCLNTDGGSVTIYAPKHSVYGDGKEEQASYKWTMVYPTTGSTIFYEKKTENGTWENITQAPTDAGTYKASLTVDIIEKTISVEYTIEKAAPVITWDSTTASTNYTGSEAVITAPVITLANGETFNGTISYSYTGTSSGNGLPTNAGTYEITASIDTYGNYNAATSSNTLELTINKVDPSYTVPTGLTATYGDTLADVALPDGFSWANSSESVGAVGTKNTTVIYTPADTTNYNTVTNIAVSVEVKAAAATVTKAPTANTLTYTGSAQDLINAGSANGGKLVYSLSEDGEFIETIPAGTNAGEYTVWYYVVGDDNHADSAKGSVKVTITKAKATITVDTTTINITYGETVTLPEATTNFGTVTCDKIAADLVNAGTYTVTYTVAGTDNYDGDTKTLTVKVEKKAVAEPTITGTYTYTGSEQTVALTGVESYMTVASGNKGTNAGNYEVEITLDNNHKWADGSDGKVQWSIGKAQAGISVNTDTITVTYGETVTLPTATANFGTVVCDKTAADLVNAGTYTVTYTVEGTTNFEGDTKSITVIVNAKSITVTADAVSKTYGEADPTLTYKVEGLVNGDELTGELNRVAGENVGDYAIEQNTLTAGNNYTISYTGAKLTINPKAITEADVKLNGSLTYTSSEQTQPITVTAGITYEVTGNKATNAGTYDLTVKGTGNYTGSVTLDWTIAKAKLTITADSKVIYIGEKVPTLTYTVTGLAGGDKLVKDPVLTTNADADQAGSYTITAANADAGDNYTITYVNGSLTIMDKETEVKTRIEITELTVVPDGLKDTQFDTVEEIKEELISKILATSTGYSAENMVHYDVALHFSLDGGDSWILATEENFPTEGITVILPYPEGTNARDYEFVVSHMFTVTSQRLGTVAGEVEMPKVEETANGISVTLNGLSPVTVAARYHDHTGGIATCTDKAICSICGTAYGELDATNHAGGTEVKNAKEATCGAEGYTGDIYCKGCNEVVEKGTTIKATGEHTYGDWKVVKEPTKTTKGEKQRTCSVCGHVDSKEIPVLSDTPATGDDSNIMLYSSMFTVSLAGLVVLLLAAKKRKQETA